MTLSALQVWALLAMPFSVWFSICAGQNTIAALGGARMSFGLQTTSALCGSLAGAYLVVRAATGIEAFATVVFTAGLCHIAVIDAQTRLVPLRLCLVLAIAGVGVAFFALGGAAGLAAGFIACLAFLVFSATSFALHRLAKAQALGEGDAYVALAVASWLSVEGLAWAIALGAAATIFIACAARLRGGPIAFAPGLAGGAILAKALV